MTKEKAPFSSFHYPKRGITQKAMLLKYRVYATDGTHVLVDAASALEAIRASGLPSAAKVVREAFIHEHSLTPDMVESLEPPNPQAEEAARIKKLLGADISGLIETDDEPEANEMDDTNS